MAQIGLIAVAVGLLFVAIQAFRGVPDSNGKTTPKSVAVVCLVLAVGLVVLPDFAGPGGR